MSAEKASTEFRTPLWDILATPLQQENDFSKNSEREVLKEVMYFKQNGLRMVTYVSGHLSHIVDTQ